MTRGRWSRRPRHLHLQQRSGRRWCKVVAAFETNPEMRCPADARSQMEVGTVSSPEVPCLSVCACRKPLYLQLRCAMVLGVLFTTADRIRLHCNHFLRPQGTLELRLAEQYCTIALYWTTAARQRCVTLVVAVTGTHTEMRLGNSPHLLPALRWPMYKEPSLELHRKMPRRVAIGRACLCSVQLQG